MPSDPADPQDDDISVQSGSTKKVANGGNDKFALTTTLTVVEGDVQVAAKGSLVTPMGCANRCKVRIWTDTSGAGTFTAVSDQDLTAASGSSNVVDYSQSLPQGSKIRYEGDLDVTLASTAGNAKVRRHRTKVKPA
jgi:hypothetical protein